MALHTPSETMPCSAMCSALQDRYTSLKCFMPYGATLLLHCYTPLLLHRPSLYRGRSVADCSGAYSMKEER
jgi:hypothetical protein